MLSAEKLLAKNDICYPPFWILVNSGKRSTDGAWHSLDLDSASKILWELTKKKTHLNKTWWSML